MRRRAFLGAALTSAAFAATPQLSASAPLATAPATVDVTLANTLWQVRIDPATLSIHVTPSAKAGLGVSRGAAARPVEALEVTGTTAHWIWPATAGKSAVTVAAQLDGHDLNLSLTTASSTTLVLLEQPPETGGHGLILPIAEGRYAAADSPEWREELLDGHNGINTTEDLTLPLWGMDHGAFTLHWLLTNPFNNCLNFSEADGGLALRLTHEFTRLDPAAPMTLTLHLGDDLLSGARRYKKYLNDAGQYQTLADKIRQTPDTQKLIGAPQTFLWGTGLISVHDVRDWPAFIATLGGDTPLATRLRHHAADDIRQQLEDRAFPADAYAQRVRVSALNEALLAVARAQWQVEVIDFTRMVSAYDDLKSEVRDTFGAALAPDPASWGQALSKRTIATLKQAGLERLWIGLGQGWEGGFWHPDAVRAAVDAGYVIGPYDGYDTIIAPGQHPDWATGQQGRLNFDTCGIVKADGTLWVGFADTGHYSNPHCYGPHMKGRVNAIAAATPYNGWYLDVTASGMVFDDYRPGHEMTMAQNAAANVASQVWLTQDKRLVISSEVGNAVTSQGIAFAQGTQTPTMGWGDDDLFTDTASPHYLGGWFPADQPGKFFKAARSKPRYRALHFSPETVIPLYQAVFHGSIITTHHWTYDNLKLTDIAQTRELSQLLFNVAPTYHLSEATLSERILLIKRQYGAFRQTHEALALHGLTGFERLSDDNLLQRTTFTDNSRLTANFSDTARKIDGVIIPPLSLHAAFSDGRTLLYQTLPVA